jgi:hypothetical protein
LTIQRSGYRKKVLIGKIFAEQFLISVIVEIEVLGFNDIPHKMTAMENFVALFRRTNHETSNSLATEI